MKRHCTWCGKQDAIVELVYVRKLRFGLRSSRSRRGVWLRSGRSCSGASNLLASKQLARRLVRWRGRRLRNAGAGFRRRRGCVWPGHVNSLDLELLACWCAFHLGCQMSLRAGPMGSRGARYVRGACVSLCGRRSSATFALAGSRGRRRRACSLLMIIHLARRPAHIAPPPPPPRYFARSLKLFHGRPLGLARTRAEQFANLARLGQVDQLGRSTNWCGATRTRHAWREIHLAIGRTIKRSRCATECGQDERPRKRGRKRPQTRTVTS